MKNAPIFNHLNNFFQTACIVVFLFLGAVSFTQAQASVTFAQFTERNGSQDYVFTNNTTSASFNTVTNGSLLFFNYSNIANLPPELVGSQNATLTFTSTTTTPAAVNGANLVQPLNSGVDTITILRDTPTPVGIGTGLRRNLLTVTFSPNENAPALTGAEGGESASFSVTTPDHTVTFTSDFISFASSTRRNFGFGFSSLSATFTRGSGNFLQSFTAAGLGTFASNPAPVYAPPTAASTIVGGRILTADGFGIPNARISMTDLNGETRTSVSNSFGNFSFDGIPVGAIYVFEIRAKEYIFTPQVITVTSEISNLNFVANQ